MTNQYERWKAYADVLGEFRNEGDYSSLWADFIRDFEVTSSNFEEVDDFIQKNCRGYSFLRRPKYFPRLRDAAELTFGAIVHLMESMWHRFKAAAKSKKLGRHLDWRTYKVYSYLRRNGIRFDEYLKPILSNNPIRISYNALKSVYLADKVFSNCNFDLNARNVFLEIGAGAGNFLIVSALRFVSLDYYVVDLPEMLLVSSFEVLKHVPDGQIFMPNDVESGILEKPPVGDRNFFFLTPSQIDRIPDCSVDLAVNIESFAEMPQEIAENYVRFFYRVLKPGGYMFTANRESRVISGNGDFTCYWKLPYSEKDEVILWEYCPMRHFMMNGMSPNINRLARIPE